MILKKTLNGCVIKNDQNFADVVVVVAGVVFDMAVVYVVVAIDDDAFVVVANHLFTGLRQRYANIR